MIFASTVWANSKSFAENYTPIVDIANIYRNQKNIHHPWHILVLHGYEYYKEYKDQLQNLNCYICDVSNIYHEILYQYRNIHNLYINNNGHCFHTNNTLRWSIAARYFENQDFLHTDIDLIINDEPQNITANTSLYMGSTCFVNIKNVKEFKYLYTSMLHEYADDPTKFYQKITLTLEEDRDNDPWGIFSYPFLTEEALFYIFLKTHNLDWSDRRGLYIHIPFIASMFGKIQKRFDRQSDLKPEYNVYTHKDHRHFINNSPMAYMHYQYNFRLILSFYLLQKTLSIPKDMLYCPNIHTIMLRSKNTESYYHNMAQHQKLWRQKKYTYNFIADFLLGKFLVATEHTDATIENFKPEIYKNILSLERSDLGLVEVLNNNFWYAKQVFV